MVYSLIDSSIHYSEKHGIDPEDRGYQCSIYEFDILGKTVVIALGKIKYTYSGRGVIFYPVYLVSGGKIKSQIGVFEVRKTKAIDIMDEDGDVNVSLLDPPLLYGFVSESFIDRSGSDLEHATKLSPTKKDEPKDEKNDTEEESEENEDIVVLETTTQKNESKEVEHANKVLLPGVFEHDDKIKPPPLLQEETESDAKVVPKYKSTSKDDSWIVKYMSNKNYQIHQVEANGDCLFAVVRDAYKQISQITTVAKLRAIVAKEATQTVFDNQRYLFLELDSIVKGHEKRLKEYKDILENVLRERAEKARNKPILLAEIMKEKDRVKEQYEEELHARRHAQNMIDENVGDFSAISTLEEFRAYIRTTSYWADVWSISVLERVLQMKIIMFSERSFKEKAMNSIVQCGEVDEELRRSRQFRPRFYIMTSFSGDHFKLVSYKDKRIFEYHEIPYNVRMLIVNKCIQRAEGPFYMIKEFREFAAKLGAEEDLRKVDDPDEDVDPKFGMNDLYEHKTLFVFHARAEMSKKPGKGTNELIESTEVSKFLPLHRIESWRRKLDDEWTDAIFKVDGKIWSSVEHFYQGAKFRKQNPEFRELFATSEEDVKDLEQKKKKDPTIATNIALAQGAGSKNGKPKGKKTIMLRPANTMIDPDFYGGRNEEERMAALRAKFTQNEDLKQLLMATYPAELKHYTSGPPTSDIPLMVVRKELVLSRDTQSKKAE